VTDAAHDAYRAPRDEGDEDVGDGASHLDGNGFYIVATGQMVLFELLTLGLYTHYWFYKHWQHLRQRHGFQGMPLVRAIFPIFFVHALFGTIDRAARRSGFRPRWSASGQAALFLGVALGASLLGYAGREGALVAFFGRTLFLLPLATAQNVANLVSGDRNGTSSRLSAEGLLFAGLIGTAWFSWWWFGS
jgi:hypothetical protein